MKFSVLILGFTLIFGLVSLILSMPDYAPDYLQFIVIMSIVATSIAMVLKL